MKVHRIVFLQSYFRDFEKINPKDLEELNKAIMSDDFMKGVFPIKFGDLPAWNSYHRYIEMLTSGEKRYLKNSRPCRVNAELVSNQCMIGFLRYESSKNILFVMGFKYCN